MSKDHLTAKERETRNDNHTSVLKEFSNYLKNTH